MQHIGVRDQGQAPQFRLLPRDSSFRLEFFVGGRYESRYDLELWLRTAG
jgi:hypothetical protein